MLELSCPTRLMSDFPVLISFAEQLSEPNLSVSGIESCLTVRPLSHIHRRVEATADHRSRERGKQGTI